MADQRAVQQIIQSLTPSGVNNGNPNTAYNQPRQSTPPPIIGADGQWYLNTINPAANQAPQQLGWNAWNAPANSVQQTKVQWPVMQQPPTTVPGGSTTVPPPSGGGIPSTPVPVPGTPAPGATLPGNSGHNVPLFPPEWQIPADVNIGDGGVNSGCVAIDQEIYGFISPEGVEVGDMMPTVNVKTYEMGEHEVTFSETKLQPCVIITTESGAELKCSKSAPLLDRAGVLNAEDVKLGDRIAVQVDGMFDFSAVVSVEDVGQFSVQHITCGDQFFLAGNGNGKYILHHNVKFIEGTGRNNYEGYDQQMGMLNFGGDGYDGPNTRGAMQAAGTWDLAHGGTASNPATAWGQSQMPTGPALGQGIIDMFGTTDNPLEMYNAVSESLGTSAAPISGNALGNLTGGNVANWNPNMGSAGTVPPAQAAGTAPGGIYGYQNTSPEANDTGGLLDKAINWFDNHALGNTYDETTNSWNKGNIGLGVLSGLLGLPIDDAVQWNSLRNLFTDGGAGSDYARTQTQQAFDRSDYAQREAMITNLAEQYKKSPQEVLQIIGRLPQ